MLNKLGLRKKCFLFLHVFRKDAELEELANRLEDEENMVSQLQTKIKDLEVGFSHLLKVSH